MKVLLTVKLNLAEDFSLSSTW